MQKEEKNVKSKTIIIIGNNIQTTTNNKNIKKKFFNLENVVSHDNSFMEYIYSIYRDRFLLYITIT